jgi:aminoglycoside phosphotransferase (APT) family kinase protein
MTAVVGEESRAPGRAVPAVPPEVLRALAGLSLEPAPGDDTVGYLGRNDNWGITVDAGRRVFVKRLSGAAGETADRLARAADFAAFVRATPPRHWHAPALLGSDPGARVLVFEHVPDAVTARERIDSIEASLVRRIGRAVGELHSMPLPAAPAAPGRTDRPQGPRQSGLLSALTLDQYARCSGADLEAWALLQHDKQLGRALAGLAASSHAAPQVPGHGDLRLDQVLLTDDGIHLVDWEEFGPADPAVDVGSFAGEWLYSAASAMFSAAGGTDGVAQADAHEDLVARGARELEVVRPLIMAFWTGYCQGYEPDEGLAARAAAYAGWHLFDRVLAKARYAADLTALDRGIAGIGRNALIGGADFVATIGLEDA